MLIANDHDEPDNPDGWKSPGLAILIACVLVWCGLAFLIFR